MMFKMRVAADKVEAVEARLGKLNTKRVKKLGMAPVVMTTSAPFIENQMDPNDKTKTIPVEMVTVTFECEPVKVSGWEFVAMLERVKEDREYNIVTWTRTGGTEAWRDVALRCDHCGKNRMRKSAAILEDANGQQIMVGTTCLTDFLGHTSAQVVKAMADLADFEKKIKGDGSLRMGFPMAPLYTAVEAVVRVIAENGAYVSSAASEYTGSIPTWKKVMGLLNGMTVAAAPVTSAIQEKAQQVMDHLRKTHDEAAAAGINTARVEDFNYKIFVLVELGHVKMEAKWLGILSGAVSYALRKGTPAQAQTTLPGFWGSVGQRHAGMFKPVKTIPVEGYYGKGWLVIGTIDNHRTIWWASSESAMKAIVNDGNGLMRAAPVPVTATVKQHRVGKYGEETVVKSLRIN
jgi:hypothetical protein